MNFIKKIFCRRKQFKPQPKQLRIDGVKATLTPTPDDAELAAQALLKSLAEDNESRVSRGNNGNKGNIAASGKKVSALSAISAGHKKDSAGQEPPHDAQYYRDLSEKIRTAHEHDARMAMRYVAYVEGKIEELKNGKIEELKNSKIEAPNGGGEKLQSFNSSILPSLEHGLFKWQDTVEREGGDLLRRWQKCLAECILWQMKATDKTTD